MIDTLTVTVSEVDDKRITSFRGSEYPQFDYTYAKRIKDNHPSIWGAGGNADGDKEWSGDRAFGLWGKARSGDVTKTVEEWLNVREAWMARHKGNANLAGVIAVMKWGGVVEKGEDHMKSVIQDAIDKAKPVTEMHDTLMLSGRDVSIDIPFFEAVDIAGLTKGDPEPFYLVRPLFEIGKTSGANILYDETLVGELVAQMPGKGGAMGHPDKHNTDTAFPMEVADWVGAKRVGNIVYGKAYIPPGETREMVRRIHARGGGIRTSIFAKAIQEVDAQGHVRLRNPVLRRIDLAPETEASHKAGEDKFDIVYQMDKMETSTMTKTPTPVVVPVAEMSNPADMQAEMRKMLSEMSIGDLMEMLGDDRMDEISQMYAKRKGKSMVAAEMVAEMDAHQTVIVEMRGQIDALQQANAAFQERAFNTELDRQIETATAWGNHAHGEDAQAEVAKTRKTLRALTIAELNGRQDVDNVQTVVQTVIGEQGHYLAAVQDRLAGPTLNTATDNNHPTELSVADRDTGLAAIGELGM